MANGRDEGEMVPLQPNANAGENFLYQNQREQNIPAEQPVPQDVWYLGLLATLCTQCHDMCEFCTGPWLAFFGGKLEAISRCLCLPCCVLTQAVDEQRTYFKQSGIVYLFLFLSITVVINLVIPLKGIDVPVSKNIQKYFMLFCIVLALTGMLYLWLFTLETVEYHKWNFRAGYPPEALMRVFYQSGLYFFGFLTFGYSLCIVINNITCGKPVEATVNVMKALYVVVQNLFLNRFYNARIRDDTPKIQIVLAQLLGTNLALWFWTLCSEEVSESGECVSYPIPYLNNTEKYFSPLFVEYLLIAASLFYEIWTDLLPTQSLAAVHCPTCVCQINADNEEADQRRYGNGGAGRIRAAISRSLGLGVVIGCCFAVAFLILVIASTASGKHHQDYHVAYSGGVICLYLTQILACYIILLSTQSLAWDPERTSVDHEDALLYISLVGSLLWEGFHLYSLVLIDWDSNNDTDSVASSDVRHLDVAADTLAMLQYVFQTTTLITLRRHQPMQGRRTTWISQCVLFLVTTNIGLWVENSFFIEVLITTPGEKYSLIQKDLKPIGYIVHPLNIFFRFHSAVYCLITWSIFRA